MARRKNAPESIRVKHGLSDRLRSLRTEFYGERGGPDLARTLGIPVRTWYNYENGVTVPAEIILRIVELTSVEPVWLLRGEGPKFRVLCNNTTGSDRPGTPEGLAGSPITTLLRVALERLEEKERSNQDQPLVPPIVSRRDQEEGQGLKDPTGAAPHLMPIRSSDSAGYDPTESIKGEWLEATRAYGNLRVTDDSMAPIVAEGAQVAYAEPELPSEAFHEKLVVAWIEGTALVRWFQHCGQFALLRAENPNANPSTILVDLEQAGVSGPGPFHRVLWISTPH